MSKMYINGVVRLPQEDDSYQMRLIKLEDLESVKYGAITSAFFWLHPIIEDSDRPQDDRSAEYWDAKVEESCVSFNDGSVFGHLSEWANKMVKVAGSSWSQSNILRILLNLYSNASGIRDDIERYMLGAHPEFPYNYNISTRNRNSILAWLNNEEPQSCEVASVNPDDFEQYEGLAYRIYSRVRTREQWFDACTMSIFTYGYGYSPNFWICEHCGDHEQNDCIESFDVAGGIWCEACYEDNTSDCYGCGHTSMRDSLQWSERDQEYYCESCQDERRGSIGDYSDNPVILYYDYDSKSDKIFTADNQGKTPYYGVELEVEQGRGDKYEVARDISEYGGHRKYLWCKSDGSLNDGFEVCSHPMTFEAWRAFDIHDSVLKYRGLVDSYNTSTCGIHIHMNRTAFSDLHVLKFMTFIHEYKKLTHFIAQRKKWREYNSYSQFKEGTCRHTQRAMAQNIKSKKSNHRPGRNFTKYCTVSTGEKYTAVNIQHTNTIEVRVFKGNLREVSFRKNIEYLDALYYWTQNTPLNKLDIVKFGQYMVDNKKKYPNLNIYIEERNKDYKECMNFSKEIPEELNI